MDDFELELPDFDPQTAAETPVSDDFNLDIAPEGDIRSRHRATAQRSGRIPARTGRSPENPTARHRPPLPMAMHWMPKKTRACPMSSANRAAPLKHPPVPRQTAQPKYRPAPMELPHEDAKPDSEHADEADAGKPRNPC
jgi:hypothetical protein